MDTNTNVPSTQALGKYNVNMAGWETIRQTLYDSQSYPAAGLTQAAFFQLPQGQSSKTLSNTNMTLAGQLPANQMFLIQSIEIITFPTTPTVAADMPAAYGAGAVAAAVNDEYIFRRSGNAVFTVGSKQYLQEAPLTKFPAKTHFEVMGAAADSSTSGTNQQTRIAWPLVAGRPYLLSPAEINLTANQNFIFLLSWPEGLQAITNPMNMFVVFDGFLYRRPQ